MTEPWLVQSDRTAERLNRLAEALGARSYLEIGVATGATFERVRVPQRTAVDPSFLFDATDRSDEATTFAEVTSDEFFSEIPAGTVYDLVFLDGLHTFEQTYRDLCNCILHSHARTVMLLDDTLPCDVYSTLRTFEEATAYRAATGDYSSAWQGDTFKVMFAVHDFHLGLDYRTIVGSGNPQTLVWRANTGRRLQVADSLEVISRMTYFDLMSQYEVLRVCDEDTAIAACIDGIAPTGNDSFSSS